MIEQTLIAIPTIGALLCHWRVMLPRPKQRRLVFTVRWEPAPRRDDTDVERVAKAICAAAEEEGS